MSAEARVVDPTTRAVVARTALFATLPPDLRELVAAALEPQHHAFGDTVVADGEPADALYIVTEGRARVVAHGDGGVEVPLASLEPGDIFGEVGLLRGGVRTASVRASSPLSLLRLDAAVFRALVATRPALRGHLEKRVAIAERRSLLRTSSRLSSLPAPVIADLAERLTELAVPEGTVVVREGERFGPMYVVREGRLRAFNAVGGPQQALAYLGPGDVFGEAALFTGAPRAATVEAVRDCVLLRLDPDDYARMAATHPALHDLIAAWVGGYRPDQVAGVPLDLDELLPAEVASLPVAAPGSPSLLAGAEVVGDGDAAAMPAAPRRRRRRGSFPLVRQIDEADCGAACLAMLSRYHGRPLRLARARVAARTGIDGTSLRSLVIGAQELGLEARAVKLSKARLESSLPAIVHWDGNHWVVAYAADARTVRYADPAGTRRQVPRAEFEERWSGYAVLAAPGPAFAAEAAEPGPGQWLRPLARPLLRPVSVAAVLALVVAGLQLALPVLVGVVVDRVLPEGDVDLLRIVLLAVVGLLVATAVGSFVQRWVLSHAAVRLDRESLDVLTERLLALPLSYFVSRRTGDIQRRITGLRLLRQFAVTSGVAALTAAAQLLFGIVLMATLSGVLTLVFLALTPLYAVLLRVANRKLRPAFDELEESFGHYASRQIDAVKGIESVKAMGAEDALRAELGAEFEKLSQRVLRADLGSLMYDGGVQFLGFVSFGLFLAVGAQQVLDGALTVGQLVAFQGLLVLASGPLALLLTLYDELQLHHVLVDRLDDVFTSEPEQGSDHSGLRPVRALGGAVQLAGVTFAFDGAEATPILSDLTLDVPAGQTVAIVGRSGSGKTTLLRLLAGLLQPTSGTIRFDGVDLATLDHRSLRQHLGVCLQDSYLFGETIARNIALGDTVPDMDKVVRAAQVADAHDFVTRLPLGYETRVGESGLLLSGGQRQRVALARAVYRQPAVLLLDEATSALDSESERAVQENLAGLLRGRTAFVIAHRLSTVRNADRIVVLERGRIVEQGTHTELLERRGLYFHLCSQQLSL